MAALFWINFNALLANFLYCASLYILDSAETAGTSLPSTDSLREKDSGYFSSRGIVACCGWQFLPRLLHISFALQIFGLCVQ